jgi:hypothetical protein
MISQYFYLSKTVLVFKVLILCALIIKAPLASTVLAKEKLKADCQIKLEQARLWIRATDFNAPVEEKTRVKLAVADANKACVAARKLEPDDGALLVNSAYALFAAEKKKEAVKLIEKASKIGYPPAMIMVARYLGQGKYMEKDAEGAYLLLIEILKTRHASARIQAALEFLPGGVGPESMKRTKATLLNLINEGNSEAMISYAMKVLKLQEAKPGTEASKEGMKLLERAAREFKNPKALIFLSLLYNQGNVVQRDAQKAIEYAQLAIDVNVSRAYGTMGQIYQNQGDNEKAVEWFKKGAAIDDGFSQGMLGFMYSGGFGVKQDLAIAIEWWKKGRWNGDRMAASYLQVHRDKQQEKKAWEESQKEKPNKQ